MPAVITPDYHKEQRTAQVLAVQAITLSRVVACFVFVSIALQPALAYWTLGLAVLAAGTDLVDGWLARRWGVATPGGSMLDACADKAMSAASVLYAVAVGMPPIPCLMVLFRDLAVLSLRQVTIDGAPLMVAQRWIGGLTAAPIRLATLFLLGLQTAVYPAPPILEWLFWFSGLWSVASLAYVLHKDLPRLRKAFTAEAIL
jgi:phosphatidylglycerophosphate synthase